MRLQEVNFICHHARESWCDPLLEEKKIGGGTSYYRLGNASEVKQLLAALFPIESLATTITNIRNTSVGFVQTDVEVLLDLRNKNVFIKEYELLKSKVFTITELFESINYEQSSTGFDIKLPANISLSDLSKCTKDLDNIFSRCPLLSKLDGSIAFSAVDVGSVWLSFLVIGSATSTILTVLAKLVDCAIIIRSHYLETKKQEETIRNLEMGNEMLESFIKINQEVGKKLLERVSLDLTKEYEINDPEDNERLKNSLQLLSDWMSKGMEVYASVQAPQETKAIFPPLETQSLPTNNICCLADKKTESEE